MTAVSETDIKELKEFINNRFEQLDKGINALDRKIDTKLSELDKKLDVYIARTDEKLNGIDQRISEVGKKISNLEGRVNSQTNWFIGIFSVLVAGLLGILGKIALFPNL